VTPTQLPAGLTNPTVVGALLVTFAVSCVAVDTVIIRVVSSEIHPLEIAFFRNLFSVVAVLPFLVRSGLGGLKTPRLPLHIARAGLKLFALVCFFFAVSQSPMAMVTAIAFSSPLFIALGSMAFLGEPWRRMRLIGLVIGFAGVLLVIRPGFVPVDTSIMLAMLSALGLAAVGLLMKYVSVREAPHSIVALNVLLTVPIAGALMVPVWTTPSPMMLGLMIVQGLIGGVAQLSVSRAMSMADASVISPIEFLRLPLVVVLAWFLFQEPTDVWTIAGGSIIFAATLATVLNERRRRPIEPELE
jgi:drug/metabolite transporter (DMT)-like permease